MAEIAGIVVSLLGQPAMALGKCIVAPIKRQFNYLCCFSSNIQTLRHEAKKLDDARAGLQTKVDMAKWNAQVIRPEVETWLASANENQSTINGIEMEIPKVETGFSNVKSRFSLSKKAKKTSDGMKKLIDGCNFSDISHPPLPPAMGSVPFGPTNEFESRKRMEEDIMATLRSKKANMVGIYGMGGIGKTTMAKRIMARVRKENLFDEVVMVVVSQQVDVLRIQREIAESLGLKLEEETLSVRAHRLRNRLMSTTRTLLVLDDVWEQINLEELGIPCNENGLEGCTTVLLTSRYTGVFSGMDAQKVCVMQILSEAEAWLLFREKVGSCVDDHDLFYIGREVVRECKGLPIALITVGRALKDQRAKPIWEDALQQLKSSNPIDMPRVLADVYNPLKLSYDFLDNRHARSLFLLCCLFPEDRNIPLEYLNLYAMGLHMFEGITSCEKSRNRVYTLVEMLKSRFLLQDGLYQHVKMHDVVRDVAIFIASKEGLVNLNYSAMDSSRSHSCTWISVFAKQRNHEFLNPMGLSFPNLRLLLVDNSESDELEISEHHNFQGMKELNVLSITSIRFTSLPQTIQLLKNLRTLHLDSCTLETISIVGELSGLEILCCRYCYSIQELPIEIKRLRQLRLLEFLDCKCLKTIAPGVISSLVQLEELKMIGSFKRWEPEENKGEKRMNAALKELESLTNLTNLEIEIEDCNLAAEELHLSSKLTKYEVQLAEIDESYITTHDKKMFLELPQKEMSSLGSWIYTLLRSTERLCLKGHGSHNLDLSQAQNMRWLILDTCWTMKKLVNTASIDWRFGVFPLLESLTLGRLPSLEELCDGPIPMGTNSFANLRNLTIGLLPALKHLWKSSYQNVSLSNLCSIKIWSCDSLRNVLPLTLATLPLLERIEVKSCEMMEEVFLNEDEKGGRTNIQFPKLHTLLLQDLPRLTTVVRGIESIEFPRLTDMDISECPNLTGLACAWDNSISADSDDDYVPLFCNRKVPFDALKELTVRTNKNTIQTWRDNQISSFFFPDEFGRGEMGKVIGDEEKGCEKSPFPSLERLKLRDLPKLETLCGRTSDLEFPSSISFSIANCPLQEAFPGISQNSPM